MVDDASHRNDEASRRTFLRRGAALVTAGALGVGTVGTAAATEVCPRSADDWMHTWHENLGDSVEVPPAGTMTKYEVQNILGAPKNGNTNGITIETVGDTVNLVAKQYVATYLNLLLRPDPDNSCATEPVAVDGIGTVQWVHVKNSAQKWLKLNEWDGTRHSGSREWTPTVAVEGVSGRVDGEVLKDALEAFNGNEFDELDCDCGEET